MRLFHRAGAVFQARRKWRLQELSDWVLAPLGAISFVIAGYWTMAISEVLPSLVRLTNQTGFTWVGFAIFAFLGGLALSVWFYGCLATRCHSILLERHFR